jgi:5-methylcytosine-specific restriction enzyme A
MGEYQHHRFYGLQVWKRRRAQQRRREPFCAMCLAMGKAVPATIVDHIIPHKGNSNAFRTGALQSLCKDHHDSAKRIDDLRSFSSQIGVDGWPVDPDHPVYGTKRRTDPATKGTDQLDPTTLIG